MDKRFLTAFLNPPKYKISGIELDYFCPRHYITLQALDSPFVNGRPKDGICYKDLFIALRVCSTENWTEAVKRPKFTERIKYYLLEGLIDRHMSAYAEFGSYINESMTIPKMWVNDDDSNSDKRATNLPETLAIVTVLMSKFGFSEKEAWNMPFAKAVWYATAFGIQEGGNISIITTESEEKEKEELQKLSEFENTIVNSMRTKKK